MGGREERRKGREREVSESEGRREERERSIGGRKEGVEGGREEGGGRRRQQGAYTTIETHTALRLMLHLISICMACSARTYYCWQSLPVTHCLEH